VQVIDTRAGFTKALAAERGAGRRVGLVPTMGYLHAGHASLMARAAAGCDVVAATIFVNPLQFGPAEDLASYPRDLDRDRRLAEEQGVAYLFVPEAVEMFADHPHTTVSVSGESDGLEGASRPGHFDGVATIVAKLFALAGPCRAYFGEKDYQQLAVIRRLAADLSFPVDVIGCPTVREPDGLALSSRNAYLTAAERAVASRLYAALQTGAALIVAGERDATTVRRGMAAVVTAEPQFTLDYADVRAPDLQPIDPLRGELRLLLAARLGRARLIDNLGVNEVNGVNGANA
jgi:pantoate--beta-alanine ligase